MGNLNLPNHRPAPPQPQPQPQPHPPSPPKQTIKEVPVTTEVPILKNENFSILEKAKLFGIIVLAISVPVVSTFCFTSYIYSKQFAGYEKQITELQTKIDNIHNPEIQQLQQLEIILKERVAQYNKEKQQILENPLYIETNKKIEKLDNHIIKCTVHLNNINNTKTNNYKEITKLIEIIKKEIE